MNFPLRILAGDQTGCIYTVYPDSPALRSPVVGRLRLFDARNPVTSMAWLPSDGAPSDALVGFASGHVVLVACPVWAPSEAEITRLRTAEVLQDQSRQTGVPSTADGRMPEDFTLDPIVVSAALPLADTAPVTQRHVIAVAATNDYLAAITKNGILHILEMSDEGVFQVAATVPLPRNSRETSARLLSARLRASPEGGLLVLWAFDKCPLHVASFVDGALQTPAWTAPREPADELGIVPQTHVPAVDCTSCGGVVLAAGDRGAVIRYDRHALGDTAAEPGNSQLRVTVLHEALTGGAFLEPCTIALTDDVRHAVVADVRAGVHVFWTTTTGLQRRAALPGHHGTVTSLQLDPLYTDEELVAHQDAVAAGTIADSDLRVPGRRAPGRARPADTVRVITGSLDRSIAVYTPDTDGKAFTQTTKVVLPAPVTSVLSTADSELVYPEVIIDAEDVDPDADYGDLIVGSVHEQNDDEDVAPEQQAKRERRRVKRARLAEKRAPRAVREAAARKRNLSKAKAKR